MTKEGIVSSSAREITLPLLTPAEAAAHLAISTRQLRNLTSAGSIRYVNIGCHDRETRRYALEDLQAFVESRRRHTKQPIDSVAKKAFQELLAVRSKKSRKDRAKLAASSAASTRKT